MDSFKRKRYIHIFNHSVDLRGTKTKMDVMAERTASFSQLIILPKAFPLALHFVSITPYYASVQIVHSSHLVSYPDPCN